MWLVLALLASMFAAVATVFTKIGVVGINSNLGTAIRTGVALIFAWLIVWFGGTHTEIVSFNHKNWSFLIFSGIATGISWLCYYRALQIGNVTRVVPVDTLFSLVFKLLLAAILLKEPFSVKSFIALLLLGGGTLLMVT